MLPREVPFLRIGLPLCAGIISGLYLKPGPAILSSIAGLTILGFCLSLFFNKYLVNILHGVSLNIALWLLGCFLCIIERENLSVLDNEQGKYLCTVTGFPEEKPNTYSIPLKIHGKILYNQQIKPLTGSILVYLRKDSILYKYYPGEIMVIRLTPVQVTNRGNPDEFDYRLYMEEQDIKYYSMADEGDVSCIVRPKHIKLRYKALLIREKIVKMYYARGLQGDRLALVSAITLGQKNLLDSDVKQIFMKAGIMHIMAVSGLHAAILSLFIFRILFFLKGRMNNLRTIITLLLLWLFAFVTGLTPSVLRATIMYSFITAGNLLNRKPNNLNSVLASGFVLLLARPLVLFNTSFLLSYSAVLFIICFYKDLYSKLAFGNWFADKIWQSAAVSITAQAGTLPLTILLFNRFPTWFLLTNIIIVPIASLLIILACLIPVTYPLRFISTHLASLLGFLATVTQYLTEKASSLPFASLENIGMKPFQSFLLFMVIFFSIQYLLHRRSNRISIPLTLLLVFEVTGIISDLIKKNRSELVVYNTTEAMNLGIIKGKSLQLFTNATSISQEVARHAASNNMKINLTRFDNETTFIRTSEEKILITTFLNSKMVKELRPDFVILFGKFPEVKQPLNFNFHVKGIIVSAGVKSSLRVLDHAKVTNDTEIHYIGKSGAFIRILNEVDEL